MTYLAAPRIQTIRCMTYSIFGLLNNKVILNQFMPVALEVLQKLPVQGATAKKRLDHKWNSKRQESLF